MDMPHNIREYGAGALLQFCLRLVPLVSSYVIISQQDLLPYIAVTCRHTMKYHFDTFGINRLLAPSSTARLSHQIAPDRTRSDMF